MSVATKPPADAIREAMDAIGASTQSHYTKGDVRAILNVIQQKFAGVAGADFLTVDTVKRGDVFAATLVGGKTRPWIVLRKRGNIVSAIAVSTGEYAPMSWPSKCRFWPSHTITGAVSIFLERDIRTRIIRPYTAFSHLAQIERDMAAMMAPERPARRRKPAALRAVS